MKITPVQLAQRVERWQKRLAPLGVAHFRIERITLTDDVPGSMFEANAGVDVNDDYDSVIFYFNNDYIDHASPKDLDETILHEWVHVAFRDYDNHHKLVRPWMPDQTWHMHDRARDHVKETVVDRFARTLYALYKQ